MIIDFRKYLKNKNVLVLGGMGFVGSNIVKQLTFNEAKVTVMDSMLPGRGGNQFNIDPYIEQINLNIADLRDSYALDYLVQNKDIIFNCAAQSDLTNKDPIEDIEINLLAQIKLLESCRKYNKKALIVYASSKVQDYPNVKDDKLSIYEGTSLINSVNKRASEQYYLNYHRYHGLKTCIIRLTNTFGPGMRIKDMNQNYLGFWLKQVLEGKVVEISGDGKKLTEQNFIDDVVEAFLLAAIKKEAVGEIFNLGARYKVSYEGLANILIETFKTGEYKLKVQGNEDLNSIQFEEKDYNKIKEILGWESVTSLKSAVGITLRFYEKYLAYF